jgi:anti-sigma B factor antagonist
MEIIKTLSDGKVILAVIGKLSAATAEEFRVAVDAVIPESQAVVLDFKEVSYLASAGLRVLVSTQKKLKAQGGVLTIINVGETIMEVFEVTGLDDIFDIQKL